MLAEYVRLHNAGVLTGDFSALIALFATDGVLRFEGIPVGPFCGRGQIAEAFKKDPPDDEVMLLGDGGDYGWKQEPELVAGTCTLVVAGGEIAELVINVHRQPTGITRQ